MRKVGKYEVGRTIGEGTFAKVKFAINTETSEFLAMKVLDKDTVLRNKMVEQVVILLLSSQLGRFAAFEGFRQQSSIRRPYSQEI